jgi:MFS family permease
MKIEISLIINRAIQLLLAFLFIHTVSSRLFLPIIAIFITDAIVGASLTTVGFAVALYSLAKSVVQVPVARYTDTHDGEYDDFYIMVAGSVMTALYTFGYLIISTPAHLYILSAFGGVGAALLMAGYYGIFARHVDKGSEGFEWSLFSVGGLTLSTAIGGAVGGIFADAFGFPMLFIVSGALTVAATILLIFLRPYMYKLRREMKVPPITI